MVCPPIGLEYVQSLHGNAKLCIPYQDNSPTYQRHSLSDRIITTPHKQSS